MTSEFENRLAATAARFNVRAGFRGENVRRARTGGPLTAELPSRAAARATRLTNQLTAARLAGGAAAELADLGLERILGANDLLSVSFLEAGCAMARTVARIKVRSIGGGLLGYGTGFLVSPQVLLTNHHVLPTNSAAGPSIAEFDFRDTATVGNLQPREFLLRPDLFYRENKELDCAFVAVDAQSRNGAVALASYGWNRLIADEGKIAIGEKLNIIQHPGGQPQQVALRANELSDVLESFLHYQTDTAPGSSGSPVFNDQWEVVALHHSGVPKRNPQGQILADDGTLWRKDMGEHRIAWVSNEGVRVSRILQWLTGVVLPPQWEERRKEILNPPTFNPPALSPTTFETVMNSSQSAKLIIPIEVTFSIGGGNSTVAAAPQAAPASPKATPPNASLKSELTDALARLRANESATYYDAAQDTADRDAFYDELDWDRAPEAVFADLSKLLRDKHRTKPPYKPMSEVYPWVDLHPDRKIRSIYSGIAFDAEEFLRLDLEVAAARQAKFTELLAQESATPGDFAAGLDALEDALPYNCEHVVPQSWFAKREPMRGDLHHLFACESGCNSFRGNIPYFDFDAGEEVLRNECGRREEGKFEPEAGHGAVARATLYFLLRYPGIIGDEQRELALSRLPILLRWHQENPPGEYEKHRNQAIFARQGNRNPLIDFPERFDRINFSAGFGMV